MLSEALRLGQSEWEAKLSSDGASDPKGWASVTLRGPGGRASACLAPFTGEAAEPYLDTPSLASCPHLQDFLRSLPGPVYLVRLLRLRPGARVKYHTDESVFRDTSFAARFHLPLSTNPGCTMSIGEPLNAPAPGYNIWNAREVARFHLAVGHLWYTNVNALHSVCNEGVSDRIHLVVDMAPPRGWGV